MSGFIKKAKTQCKPVCKPILARLGRDPKITPRFYANFLLTGAYFFANRLHGVVLQNPFYSVQKSKRHKKPPNRGAIRQGYYMLNIIHHQGKFDEKLSIDTPAKSGNNGILTQKLKAVTPKGLNWLFYCPKYRAIPPYNHFATTGNLPLMVWLILQNKPIGEYAKRLLFVPRVRPYHPIIGFLLKNQIGAFLC